MCAEGNVGKLEFADSIVVVLEVGGILRKELETVSRDSSPSFQLPTSNLLFSSFSNLKFAIFVSLRKLGSALLIVENVDGYSV